MAFSCHVRFKAFLRLAHALLSLSISLSIDAVNFFTSCFRPKASLAAEKLFLRKQLAVYVERRVKLRRATDATKLALVLLSRFFDWRPALTIVKPDTLVGWHRKVFRLFWRWKSKPRWRPRLPLNLQSLIVEMPVNNPTWGEGRIADELLLKLGLRVSPRTVQFCSTKTQSGFPSLLLPGVVKS